MRNLLLFLFLLLFWGNNIQAQQAPFTQAESTALQGAPRMAKPAQFEVLRADFRSLEQTLTQAPHEKETHNFRIDLPVPGHRQVPFSVWKIDIMHPELAAKYPGIRTYSGEALDGSGTIVRITTSEHGFEAMYLNADMSTATLEPWSWEQLDTYVLYDNKNATLSEGEKSVIRTCGVDDAEIKDYTKLIDLDLSVDSRNASEPVELRTYRFAAATTGDFGAENGGTVPSVLAVVADRVSKISVYLERDIALRLQLVPNNDEIIFTDPEDHPYSGSTVGEWLGQNQPVVNTLIGTANYDLGHLFARYFGGSAIGVANLGVACQNSKARGVSAGFPPYGQSFIETAAHEIGHQLSATHSWNACGGIPDGNRSGGTAFEPGSGSTIMSYAGGCGSNNVNGGDAYYHSGSISQMRSFITQAFGSNCGALETVNNTTPVVQIESPAGVYIPISTPFELIGSGTDADGDDLSYTWEQIDAGEEVPLGVEGEGSALFRSYPPGSASNRVFPRMNTIVLNSSDIREILPTMTRDMNFRFTARDNNPEAGGTVWEDIEFFVTDQAGPFLVEYPNAMADGWTQGAWEEVKWDVANTDLAPVNCEKVDIFLSTNNGISFPITLATDVPNTGSAYVYVPDDILTGAARIRISGVDNIFFDISNAGFPILPADQPGVSVGVIANDRLICLPNDLTVDVFTSGLAGYSDPIALEVLDLPNGATASFGSSTVLPGESTQLFVDMTNVTESGLFTINVKATAPGTPDIVIPVNLDLRYADFSALEAEGPSNGSVGLTQTPVLEWAAVNGVEWYEVEVASSPDFDPANIVFTRTGITENSIQIGNILPKGSIYYWRVRTYLEPCYSDWTEPNVFATLQDECNVFTANDLPKNLTAGVPIVVQSKVFVPVNATISDINVRKIQGYHEFFAHMEATLISPQGKEATLFSSSCGTFNGSFNFGIDDAALSNLSCPPSNSGLSSYKPLDELGQFNGDNAEGEWTLQINDRFAGGGGQLSAFELEVCSSSSLSGPFIVNNNPLNVQPGTNAPITTDLLLTNDNNNTPDQLVYTLMTPPKYGHLEKNWTGIMQPGDQFTQTELDNGNIRFFDYGNSPGQTDDFRFSVTDNEAGLIAETFLIQAMTVSSSEAPSAVDFSMLPNPSTGIVRVMFPETIQDEAYIRIFALNGQLVQEKRVGSGAANVQLNLAGAADGIYFVRVETQSSIGVRKLVIQR